MVARITSSEDRFELACGRGVNAAEWIQTLITKASWLRVAPSLRSFPFYTEWALNRVRLFSSHRAPFSELVKVVNIRMFLLKAEQTLWMLKVSTTPLLHSVNTCKPCIAQSRSRAIAVSWRHAVSWKRRTQKFYLAPRKAALFHFFEFGECQWKLYGFENRDTVLIEPLFEICVFVPLLPMQLFVQNRCSATCTRKEKYVLVAPTFDW